MVRESECMEQMAIEACQEAKGYVSMASEADLMGFEEIHQEFKGYVSKTSQRDQIKFFYDEPRKREREEVFKPTIIQQVRLFNV